MSTALNFLLIFDEELENNFPLSWSKIEQILWREILFAFFKCLSGNQPQFHGFSQPTDSCFNPKCPSPTREPSSNLSTFCSTSANKSLVKTPKYCSISAEWKTSRYFDFLLNSNKAKSHLKIQNLSWNVKLLFCMQSGCFFGIHINISLFWKVAD